MGKSIVLVDIATHEKNAGMVYLCSRIVFDSILDVFWTFAANVQYSNFATDIVNRFAFVCLVQSENISIRIKKKRAMPSFLFQLHIFNDIVNDLFCCLCGSLQVVDRCQRYFHSEIEFDFWFRARRTNGDF